MTAAVVAVASTASGVVSGSAVVAPVSRPLIWLPSVASKISRRGKGERQPGASKKIQLSLCHDVFSFKILGSRWAICHGRSGESNGLREITRLGGYHCVSVTFFQRARTYHSIWISVQRLLVTTCSLPNRPQQSLGASLDTNRDIWQ